MVGGHERSVSNRPINCWLSVINQSQFLTDSSSATVWFQMLSTINITFRAVFQRVVGGGGVDRRGLVLCCRLTHSACVPSSISTAHIHFYCHILASEFWNPHFVEEAVKSENLNDFLKVKKQAERKVWILQKGAQPWALSQPRNSRDQSAYSGRCLQSAYSGQCPCGPRRLRARSAPRHPRNHPGREGLQRNKYDSISADHWW